MDATDDDEAADGGEALEPRAMDFAFNPTACEECGHPMEEEGTDFHCEDGGTVWCNHCKNRVEELEAA